MKPLDSPLTVAVVSVLILSIMYLYQSRLPSPILTQETGYEFCEQRAYNHLKEISSKIGSKVVGTIQEYQSKEYIKQELRKLLRDGKESSIDQVTIRGHVIELEEQNVSGDIYMEIIGRKLFTTYSNVTNIIVKITPPKQVSNNGLLVSSHFDSGYTSPGFYDDGVPVVCMMESFQNIIKMIRDGKLTLKRNLVYLFNGAEEVGLIGAHAFFYHKWSKDVRYFLNLEAAGSGGKEVAFQIKSHFLAKQFSKFTKRPSGNVVAQDIFQANLIPSATDYFIYDRFNLSGIDLSFYKNGYVYHTSLDSEIFYEPGSVQHMGDNVQSFVTLFASNNEEESEKQDGKFVYFDLFNLVVVTYNMEMAKMINIAVLIVGFTLMVFSVFKDGVFSLFDRLVNMMCVFVSLFCALGISATLAMILISHDKRMLYYSLHPMFAVGVYGSISLMCYFTGLFVCDKVIFPTTKGSIRDSIVCIWLTCLAILTYFSIPSGYIFMVVSACLILAYYPFKNVEVISTVVALVGLAFFHTVFNQVIDMFIPMSGRMGKQLEADLGVSMLISVLFFFSISIILPLIAGKISVRHIFISIVVTVGMVVALLFINKGAAFSKLHPSRASLQHTFHFKSSLNAAGETSNSLYNSYLLLISPHSGKEETLLTNVKESFTRLHDHVTPQNVRGVISPKKLPAPYLAYFTNSAPIPDHVIPKVSIRNTLKTNQRIVLDLTLDERVFHSTIYFYTNQTIGNTSFNTSISSAKNPSSRQGFTYEYVIGSVFGYSRDAELLSKKQKKLELWVEFENSDQQFVLQIVLENAFLTNTEILDRVSQAMPEWSQVISTTHSTLEFAPLTF